jgi:hypothetical protein
MLFMLPFFEPSLSTSFPVDVEWNTSDRGRCVWLASFLKKAATGPAATLPDLLGDCAVAVLLGVSRVLLGTSRVWILDAFETFLS